MTLILGLAGVYLAVLVALWAVQERITFPAPRAALPDPTRVIATGERIELTLWGARYRGRYLLFRFKRKGEREWLITLLEEAPA